MEVKVQDMFLIELLMVLVDRLGGEVEVNQDDLHRVVDGVNELRMLAPEGDKSTSLLLSVRREVDGEE